MTTALKLTGVNLPGVGYPNIRDFVAPNLPNRSGLVGLYTFGPKQEMSIVNQANNTLPLIPRGKIQFSSNGAVVNKSGYFDTQLAQDDEYTVIALCMPLLVDNYNNGQLIYSNYKNGDSLQGESIGMFGENGNGPSSFGSFLNTSGNALSPKSIKIPSDVSAARHACFAVRVNADGSTKAFILDKGVLTVGASAATTRMPLAGRTMLIGPGYVSGVAWAGNLTVKVMAVYSNGLTDQQINENMSYLAQLYSDKTS